MNLQYPTLSFTSLCQRDRYTIDYSKQRRHRPPPQPRSIWVSCRCISSKIRARAMRSRKDMFALCLATIFLGVTFPVYAWNSPVLEWSWTSSSVLPTSLNVMMTPSVIDLNKDGIPDVVFGSTASTSGNLVEVGVLRALNGNNGSELFTVTTPALQINTASSVATGDIDGDGYPEIIACDSTGARLIAFEHDGTFKWRSPTLEAINWGAPAIANLDKVGLPEIVIGRQVLNADGTLRWTGTGGRATVSNIGPLSLVADVDLDGNPEVVAGNTVYSVNGVIKYRNTSLPDGYNAVGNFDSDPQAEIVLVANGSVWLLEHNMTVKWGPVSIPGGGGGPPTVADYDNDGNPEIGVAGYSRYAVFETNGALKWQAATHDYSSSVTGSSVFDFEGDGAAEVVYGDEFHLWIYRGVDGAVLFQTNRNSGTWYEYPLVADVDGDNNAELLIIANVSGGFGPQHGIYVYGDPTNQWVLTRKIWNEHTYHITNVNPDGSIPIEEENNWQVPGLNNFRLNEFGQFEGPACDIDQDRDVDRNDINAILAARNQPAAPGDPRDYDGDGLITVGDARACVLKCTRPNCAIQ